MTLDLEQINLHDTTDAAVWAAEFCNRWPSALCQIPGKEGVSDGDDWEATMIGWFANAIMAGVDSEARKAASDAARIAELEGYVAALKEALDLTSATLAQRIGNRRSDAWQLLRKNRSLLYTLDATQEGKE